MRSLFLVLSYFLLAAVTCAPSEDGPPPDSCSDPDEVQLEGIEIGADTSLAFLPLGNGDSLRRVGGLQGANMVGVRLRLSGSAQPSCLAQSTRIRDRSGATVAQVDVPLRTYESDDSSGRATSTLWLPFSSTPAIGSEIQIEVRAGGVTMTRLLRLTEEPPAFQPTSSEIQLALGGTGVLTLALDYPASADIRVMVVGSQAPSAIEPRIYTIPEGASQHSILLSADALQTGGNETLLLVSATQSANVSMTVDAAAPGPGLVINEVYPGTGSIDINCDGDVDQGDVFVEIHNPYDFAQLLDGVSLSEMTSSAELHSLTELSGELGPRETLVLTQTQPASPDCMPSPVLVAPTLLLDESAVYIELGNDRVNTFYGATSSRVRDPEFTGPMVSHEFVEGSSRAASPGTRSNNTLFADPGEPL